MNCAMILYILGALLGLEGLLMLLPCLVGVIYGESTTAYLFVSAIICFISGLLLRIRKPKKTALRAKDGFVLTALAWIIISILGALPFVLSGEIPDFTDAVFEVVSGFTTTGSSILTQVESLSKCMLFWRSFTHWIGGMGVLVFLLAVLPSSADEMYIMKAESPGPSVDKLVPKVRQTAFILYAIYFIMTIITIIALILFNMPAFDAVCIALGAAGTGGFGILSDSCASYSPTCQIIITVAMFAFGVNFKFYYLIIIREFKEAIRQEEVAIYGIIYVIDVAIISITTLAEFNSASETVRHAAFQVASIMTTTGYATCDFNLWRSLPKGLLVTIMFIGACAGSTGGGMKVSRIILYFKQINRMVSEYIHPRSIKKIMLDGRPVDEAVLRSANLYLLAYMFIFVISVFIISVDDLDLITTFTSVAATINNIGPGLEIVGPCGNYSTLSILSKWTLIFDMLAGRLEIVPMLMLFSPIVWRRR